MKPNMLLKEVFSLPVLWFNGYVTDWELLRIQVMLKRWLRRSKTRKEFILLLLSRASVPLIGISMHEGHWLALPEVPHRHILHVPHSIVLPIRLWKFCWQCRMIRELTFVSCVLMAERQ